MIRRLVLISLMLVSVASSGLVVDAYASDTAEGIRWKEGNMVEESLADELFRPYGEKVYRLAQRIEDGEAVTKEDILSAVDDVNRRYGQEITLLHHAIQAYNTAAIDALLSAGADVNLPGAGNDMSMSYLAMLGYPGAPADQDGGRSRDLLREMTRLYLKHGGDPNIIFHESADIPLVYWMAAGGDWGRVKMLIDAGADPWVPNQIGGNAMMIIGRYKTVPDLDYTRVQLLQDLIDAGYFDDVPMEKIVKMMTRLSYWQSEGEERQKNNQAVARRILKRHPTYKDDRHTERLFGGPIPWAVIKDER